MTHQIIDDDGHSINSRCSIDQTPSGWHIVIESRGGARGSPNERNTEYSRGLALIVQRLAAVGAIVSSARVESARLIRRGVSEVDRRLNSEVLVYPLALTIDNVSEVVSNMKRTQAAVGSDRIKGGHNNTRRLLLSIQALGPDFSGPAFVDYVTGRKALGYISDAEFAEAVGAPLEVNSVADARKWILAMIVRRQGQSQFREELLRVYGRRCAVTECDADAVLEAAHVVPYRGIDTNLVSNGLLLRSDIHTLFDRGLLGVDPQSWTIILHPTLMGTTYYELNAAPYRLPKDRKDWPDASALADHLVATKLKSPC